MARRATLRGRVSALGLAVIAGWLVVLTVGFNVVLSRRLNAELDSALRTRAIAAAATVGVGAGGRLIVGEPLGDAAIDTGVWIFSGRSVLVSAPGDAPTQAAVRSLVGHGPMFRDSSDAVRLFALPVQRSGRTVGTVVTGLSQSPYRHTRDAALIGSALVAALALVGAFAALRLTSARALRPVDEMTRQAAEWSSAALGERFGPAQRYAELDALAETLNGVLDRQTASVRHERRLLAELSHELRTPLSHIVAEVDLLLTRPHDAARTRLAHRQVRETALAMNRIIETLLQAGSAETMSAPGSCAVEQAVHAVLAARSGRGDVARRDVHLELAPSLVVGVDMALVERVLAPLIDNAMRYATHQVRIAGRRTSDSVLVDISDDGPGVPDVSHEDIFEPGVQVAIANRPPSGGAGLGLALARRLARTAGGEVTYAGGARFEIRLPPA